MIYSHRYIAKITIEAETPLSVGSGEKGLVTDRIVAKDANGLPYIPGTSLTGVLRNSLIHLGITNDIFGSGGSDGEGSRLIVSSACLLGEDGKTVIEGLKNIDTNSGYYSFFTRLPERDHVRMTDKGVADSANRGKYDEELVHKGTRFVFELELIGDSNDEPIWQNILDALDSPVFRIGAGTRKGFGKLLIIPEQSKQAIFDLTKEPQLLQYFEKSGALNDPLTNTKSISFGRSDHLDAKWQKYILSLKAKDFFLFGAGFGDDDADNKPKTEKYFDWKDGKPKLVKDDFLLIPATSIKGIIAHRVAYYYNKQTGAKVGTSNTMTFETSLNFEKAVSELQEQFKIDDLSFAADSDEWNKLEEKINSITIDSIKEWDAFQEDLDEEIDSKGNSMMPVGENNAAVKALFGYSKNSEIDSDGLRGRVIINDIYLPYDLKNDKVFNHVKIDRFTNGTIDGALFQEKASQYANEIKLEIWVDKTAFDTAFVKEAFEQTLNEILEGKLQLGGNSAKGHGVFSGTLSN